MRRTNPNGCNKHWGRPTSPCRHEHWSAPSLTFMNLNFKRGMNTGALLPHTQPLATRLSRSAELSRGQRAVLF